MKHRQSWCIAALPLGDAAYLTKTWCYFAFWRIHCQATLKAGSQLVLKCFFWGLFFPTSRQPPLSGSSCTDDVIAQPPRRYRGTRPGSRCSLPTAFAHIFCWRQAAFTPLRCICFVWFARGLNILCVYGQNPWLYRESEDCCVCQANWTVCSSSM